MLLYESGRAGRGGNVSIARLAGLCVFGTALFTGVCFGEDMAKHETPWRLWGGVGGGLSRDRVMAMGELVFQKGPHQISARALVGGDPYGAEGGVKPTGEIGLLYGRTAMSRIGHVSISSGLAITDTDMDSEQGMTLGVPIVGEAALRVVPFMGLGAQFFGNLNSEESYMGLALFMQFGYMPGDKK